MKRNPGAPADFARPAALLLAALLLALGSALFAPAQSSFSLLPGPQPRDIPAQWQPWIGEYRGPATSSPIDVTYVVSEQDGFIQVSKRLSDAGRGRYDIARRFRASSSSPFAHGYRLGTSRERELVLGDTVARKTTPDRNAGAQILVQPVRPVSELRREALAASPPAEKGPFRAPDLLELAPLDPAIHLDIRYATSNDFLGAPVYTQARAFLQRPAAQALLRILRKLKPLGYGLLIHDAYRPWFVTRIFWDATPPEGKIFVADPSQGSRHNRGCAVDLTLYRLATGQPVEMPGAYDEMSPRSFPDYPGGTSLQRWHRELLRRAMESDGFTVYDSEWWHFDYQDWREYPILNVPFEKLDAR